jgi:release factor glutamine methyltransferase
MRVIVKYIVSTAYRPLLVKYLSKTRTYSCKGILLEIPPQVFHPAFFFSTKLLLRYIGQEYLNQKSFLELGAGSGLLSIYAAKRGADVVATDINPIAVQCVLANAEENGVAIRALESDLFDRIPLQQFDCILINPPYYKRTPSSLSEYAWYCGENGEYFQKLFRQLKDYVHEHSKVFMVLCDGCDIPMIKNFAHKNSFRMQCVHAKEAIIEKNYIFKIESMNR